MTAPGILEGSDGIPLTNGFQNPLKNMIISKLEGGLGNQLFQYSIGRSAASFHQTDLKLDLQYYQKSSKREYKLDNFNIRASVATVNELKPFERKKKRKSWLNPFNRVSPSRTNYYQEAESGHAPGIHHFRDNSYLEGYWQNPKWFDHIRVQLLEEITPVRPPGPIASGISEMIAQGASISLHVRRGDYLKPRYKAIYHQLTNEYAAKGIRLINDSEGGTPVVYVFSDEIDWVRDQFHFDNPVVFASDTSLTDCEELMLMTQCHHNIIANSTFSWWGAWLNPNPLKIVVSPERWFQDASRESPDLVPDSWMKI
jgi:hypothetical protein